MEAGGDDHVRVILDTAITFDTADDVLHCPMVEATIGRAPTKLILDTGASDHVLTIELADRAGLSPESGEPGMDHTGASIPSWTLGDVPIDVAGVGLDLRGAVAINAPGRFEEWGIGGLLSPQNMHPTAFVRLDMASQRLLLLDGGTEDVLAWLSARYPRLRPLTLERRTGGPVVVQASIEPYPAVDVILDSGSSGTDFARAAVPDLRGERLDAGYGVGGAGVAGESLSDRILRVGEATVPLATVLVRDHLESFLGLMGMDVLRGTVLSVSAATERPVLWLIPGPATS